MKDYNWNENMRRQQPADYPRYYAKMDPPRPLLSRWQSALNVFVAGMGLLGWLLLFLFIWVATP